VQKEVRKELMLGFKDLVLAARVYKRQLEGNNRLLKHDMNLKTFQSWVKKIKLIDKLCELIA
jgi:hypothetical protein